MAKKTVATLQTKSKRLTKAIKMVRSEKSGAYTYVETILATELVNDWLSKKKKQPFKHLKSHILVAFFILKTYL